MAGNQNASMAIDHETKRRLKEFTDAYEEKNGKKLSAKDFVAAALDYFDRTGAELTDENLPDAKAVTEYKRQESSGMEQLLEMMTRLQQQEEAHHQEQKKHNETSLKFQADTALKVTAIGQGQTKIIEKQEEQVRLLESKTKNTTKELTTSDIMGNYFLTKIGDVFKVWRIKQDLTVNALAKVAKMNNHTISNIEAGKDVSLSNFLRYMNFILANDPTTDIIRLYKIYACLPGDNISSQERKEELAEYHTYIPDNIVQWKYVVTGKSKEGEDLEETIWIEDYTDKEERVKAEFLKLHPKAKITEAILRDSRHE